MIGVEGKQALNALCRLCVWIFGLFCVITSLSCFPGELKANKRYDFDVTSPVMVEALNQIAAQTGEVLLYPYDVVEGKAANPVVGRYSLMEALQIVLQDSGLSSDLTDRGIVRIDVDNADKKDHRGVTRMKSEKKSLVSALAAVLVPIFSVAENSYAQEPVRQASSLEEIVVTAQRREESLQDVPIAITALTGAELAASGITDGDTLGLVTPGLTYSRAESAASPYIRGIGASTTSSGSEGSVASYVDGIYMRDMRNINQAYNNISRVEVLKGPQGTLFGRNATGGLIQTITKTPDQQTELVAELKVGNYEVFQGDLYGTTGITENIAADIAISSRTQGKGIGKNITPSNGMGFVTGQEIGFKEHTQVRSKWLITPSDQTAVTLTFQWGDRKSDAGFLRVCGEGQICLPTDPHSPNFRDVIGPQATRIENAEAWLAAMHIDHEFEHINFSSITAYQETEAISTRNPYEPVVVQSRINLTQLSETFSQEFQLSSGYESDLQWITGIFFWDDQSHNDPLDLKTDTGFTSIVESTVDTNSYALYGQAYYDFTDATQLTLGSRWTKDKRAIDGARLVTAYRAFSDEEDWEAWSWRVALSHDFTENLLGYISFNRGFKSGAYNSAPVAGRLDPSVDPEFVDAYAIGMKGDFLDNRLRLNTEAFFSKINNLQLRATDLETTLVRYLNAAEGEVKGIEVSATALLTDNLTLQAGLSLLDTEYVSFEGCTIATPSPDANGGLGGNFINTLGDCSGNDMMQSPEATFNIVLHHSFPLPSGHIDSSLTYFYSDGYFYTVDNNWGPSSYSVINAVFSWVSESAKYEIGIYGNNVADEKYSNDGYSNDGGNFNGISITNREYGLRMKYRF